MTTKTGTENFVRTETVIEQHQIDNQYDFDTRNMESFQVCAGEFRKEQLDGRTVWRFWQDPEWED